MSYVLEVSELKYYHIWTSVLISAKLVLTCMLYIYNYIYVLYIAYITGLSKKDSEGNQLFQ